MKQEFIETFKIVTGEKPLSYYFAGFIFSLLAIILSLYLHSKERNKYSIETPIDYSWKFLLWDNSKRIVTGMIVMFLFFRLFDLSNVFLMVGLGFAVALGLDKLIQFLMENTDLMKFLKKDRNNFKV